MENSSIARRPLPEGEVHNTQKAIFSPLPSGEVGTSVPSEGIKKHFAASSPRKMDNSSYNFQKTHFHLSQAAHYFLQINDKTYDPHPYPFSEPEQDTQFAPFYRLIRDVKTGQYYDSIPSVNAKGRNQHGVKLTTQQMYGEHGRPVTVAVARLKSEGTLRAIGLAHSNLLT